MNRIILGDCIEVMQSFDDMSIDMIYADPPFNTGVRRVDQRSGKSYHDSFGDQYLSWCSMWIEQCHRILRSDGTIYVHLDDHSAYLVRARCLDEIFGVQNYLSTVIWAYDFGGRSKDRWPAKHDTILVYAKNAGQHKFDTTEVDRLPYMSPPIRKGQTRSEDGKLPTDVWWMSIVGTASKERQGYPTQKPEQLVRRAIVASSRSGDVVLDPFGGSGTTAAAAQSCGRRYIVIDKNEQSYETMCKRLDLPGVSYEQF